MAGTGRAICVAVEFFKLNKLFSIRIQYKGQIKPFLKLVVAVDSKLKLMLQRLTNVHKKVDLDPVELVRLNFAR